MLKKVHAREPPSGVVGTDAKGKRRFDAVDDGPGKYDGDAGVLVSLE
jgi:hypothetical protein